MAKKSNAQEFIEKAKKVHGNKYDYSKAIYQGRDIPVTITCPIHGDFKQTPHDHLSGCGCKNCAKISRANKSRKDLNTWISQAKNVHGDKYDYSNVNYINAHKPVKIICPIHGEFEIAPSNHVRQKQGCPKCGNLRKGQYQKSNTQEFIKKAKTVHGDKYDYSKVEYENNYTPVIITCPIHGDFKMKPIDHLNGHGCKECAKKFGIAEKFVFIELQKTFSDIEYQKSFPFLKSKTSYQTLDFYIPSLNVGIEYQGRQHFSPNKRFGNEEGYNKTYERDLRKYNKCESNGIKMYYISFEKNLPENYFAKIYTNVNDLVAAIKSDKIVNIDINDISEMVINIIKNLLIE